MVKKALFDNAQTDVQQKASREGTFKFSNHEETPFRRMMLRFLRHKLAVGGLIVLGLMVMMAIFAPQIGRYDPNRANLIEMDLPPSPTHWLGTDGVGRDYFSRLVFGSRVSLSVGLVAVSISTLIGTALGSVSGYYGGWLDNIVQRITEIVMTFPTLILIITLVALLGPSIYNAMAVIGLLGWPGLCRLVRGQFLSLRQATFVEAAHAIGVRDRVIILRHILPNVLPFILVSATFSMAAAILTEASLSFLGLGAPPPTPTWGTMIQDAQTLDVLAFKPWRWLAPGLAIAACVLSINFVGDGLRDALDPRMIID